MSRLVLILALVGLQGCNSLSVKEEQGAQAYKVELTKEALSSRQNRLVMYVFDHDGFADKAGYFVEFEPVAPAESDAAPRLIYQE